MSGYQIPISADGLALIAKGLEDSATAADHLSRSAASANQNIRELGKARINRNTLGGRDPGDTSLGGGIKYATNLPQERADRAQLDAYFAGKARGQTPVTTRDIVRADDSERLRRTPNNGPRDRVFQLSRGAHQQYDLAVRRLRTATESGDNGLIEDAQAAVRRAEKALQNQRKTLDGPKPKNREDYIMEAFMTSRVGPGGQLLPLVNRLRKAGLTSAEDLQEKFGMNAGDAAKMAPFIQAAAKLALPVAGAIAGVGAAFALAEYSAATYRKVGGAYWTAGGTPGETAQMLGIGGDNAAQKAMSLGSALQQGTYGASYMRGKGVVDLGPYTVDKASNYIRAIDELRKIKTDKQAIRVARDLGMTDDLWMRDLSQPDFERRKSSMAGLGDPGYRAQAATYQNNKDILGNNLERLGAELGNIFTPIINSGAKGLANTFDSGFWKGFIPRPGRQSMWSGREWWNKYVFEGDNPFGNNAPQAPKGPKGTKMDASGTPWMNGQPVRTDAGPNYGNLGARGAGAMPPPGMVQNWLNQGFDQRAIALGAISLS